MTDRIGVSYSSPATSFWLEADVIGYNPDAGYTTVRCYLRAANGGNGSTASRYLGAGVQVGYIGGGEFGRVSGNPFLPGGYGAGQLRWRSGPWDVNVPMSGERNIDLSMLLQYGTINGWSYGSVYSPWVPGAPVPIGLDEIGPTSIRYRFSGTTANGSGIDAWQAQVATDPGFTQNVQTLGSSGTTTFSDLTPATRYYFRSRGHNGVGWGPWSSAVNEMTASGAYVSLNGVWVPVPLYVSNGLTWVVPDLQVSNGSTWRKPV